MKTGWEHFNLVWGKGTCPGAEGWGPGCRRRDKAVMGHLRSWTCGTFQHFRNKQAYFLPMHGLSPAVGFILVTGGEAAILVPRLFAPPSSLPLPGSHPQHCHSVSSPMPAKSNTVLNHPQKQGWWALSLGPPVLLFSVHFSSGNSSSCGAEAPQLLGMGPKRAGCSSRGHPWSWHCPTHALW